MFDDSKLSDKALGIIKSEDKVFVSIASLWEIAIKQSLGKLDLDCSVQDVADNLRDANISVLPVEPKHLDCLKTLPFIHRDPFDRLIVAQTYSEGMALITKDTIIPQYDISTVW